MIMYGYLTGGIRRFNFSHRGLVARISPYYCIEERRTNEIYVLGDNVEEFRSVWHVLCLKQ